MAYVDPDYKTKKAFKEAVANGVEHYPYNPSGLYPTNQYGEETIEGPHGTHRWYARATVKGGVVVAVK
jgi:hypothetical protein|tara:strand:- start:3555 stop:3758 length:204 start_codon:yes stop_codon:yes gene_type:complete